MTAGEIYQRVAERLLDAGVADYTPAALRGVYEQSLDTLSSRLAANHIPAVETTYYGRLQKDATVLQPLFHDIPNEAPYSLELGSLHGYSSLKARVPEIVADQGIMIFFDQPLTLPRGEVCIVREKRVPALNGVWGVQLSEDRMSALVLGAAGQQLEDQTEAAAGLALVGTGAWCPAAAVYEGDRYRFAGPMPADMLFRLKMRGFHAANYLESWASCPVAGADTYLINHTAALAVGDRSGNRVQWMADADAAFARLLAVLVAKQQMETTAVDYRKRPHIAAIRRGVWR